ncbi:MAG: nucleotidyl transferase AbiEii/AbiGii toxin family protein [Desulfuromonadaceae bacterium]|nr:nucleotidyl transferase AbiEii/AbiGii toxin family protein [Desulfuromonadaceae bacterium]
MLGLWRSRFFEHAAFYGGTALRIIHGLDRFSEDLDFSLLAPDAEFDLSRFTHAIETELAGFGFDIRVEQVVKSATTAVQSAFLKGDSVQQLLVIEAAAAVTSAIPRGQLLKIKLEVDTDPPPGFATETKYLLQPVPCAVRLYTLPDLFAGKMHAVLCRRWKNRVKGRDWYDLVWYCANHPELHLAHLESRMRQSGYWQEAGSLRPEEFSELLHTAIENLDVYQARRDVAAFVRQPATLDIWSREFFHDVVGRIRVV